MKDVSKQSNRLRILATIQKINGMAKNIGEVPESKRNKFCESFMYDDFIDDITEILLSTLSKVNTILKKVDENYGYYEIQHPSDEELDNAKDIVTVMNDYIESLFKKVMTSRIDSSLIITLKERIGNLNKYVKELEKISEGDTNG